MQDILFYLKFVAKVTSPFKNADFQTSKVTVFRVKIDLFLKSVLQIY